MANVYQIITDRIIESLENNHIPWRSGWANSMMPSNAVTGKAYSGINVMLLRQAQGEFGSCWFVTSKQAQQLGGHVKQSEYNHGSIVSYWKVYTKTVDGGPDEPKFENRFVLRYYTVYNIKQCDGIKLPKHCGEIESAVMESLPEAEMVFDRWFERTNIRLELGRPSYSPTWDKIMMPPKDSFESAHQYYAVGFHEMVHSTGHASRMNRFVEKTYFGSETYSKEELIAEIGSSFLCGTTGIDGVFDNQVSYIKGWLIALRNDPRMIVSAASKAQKAVDMIMHQDVKGV